MTSSSPKIRAKIKHHEKNTARVGEARKKNDYADETSSYKSEEECGKEKERIKSLSFSSVYSCSSRAAEVD